MIGTIFCLTPNNTNGRVFEKSLCSGSSWEKLSQEMLSQVQLFYLEYLYLGRFNSLIFI